MVRKRPVSSVEIVRRVILGAIAAIVIVILGYILIYALGLVGTGNTEPYVTLQDRELQSEPIEVIEFFSYGCPHCEKLEPLLDRWVSDNADDISFRKIHVSFDTQTKALANLHVALEQRGLVSEHSDRIFREVGLRPRTFNTPSAIADFVEGHGVDREMFQRLYASDRVSEIVERNAELTRELGIGGVPFLVVGNRYVIPPKTLPREMIKTLRDVIAGIQNGELTDIDTATSLEEVVDEPSAELPTEADNVEPAESSENLE